MPEWSFPGRGRVQRQLQRAKDVLERGEKVLQSLPLRGKQAGLVGPARGAARGGRAGAGYVELYGAYAESEAVYGVDRLLARLDALDDGRPRDFCFDPRAIDWDPLRQDIHLPSVVAHARVRTTPGGARASGGRTGCAARSCRPTGTWPPSTSRTR